MLVLVAMVAAMLLANGAALAETFVCDGIPPCYGTPENDHITGTPGGETIYAYGGEDHVIAGEGNDTVYGSSGSDSLEVEGGSDKVYGGGSGDAIYANTNDTPGSTDHSYGGGGNDTIQAKDGNEDIINCGKGTDNVIYDASLDTVTACENKLPS